MEMHEDIIVEHSQKGESNLSKKICLAETKLCPEEEPELTDYDKVEL